MDKFIRIVIAGVSLAGLTCSVIASDLSDKTVFASFSAARKAFSEMLTTEGDWSEHVVYRGGRATYVSRTTTYNSFGNVIGSSYSMGSINRSGPGILRTIGLGERIPS